MATAQQARRWYAVLQEIENEFSVANNLGDIMNDVLNMFAAEDDPQSPHYKGVKPKPKFVKKPIEKPHLANNLSEVEMEGWKNLELPPW